MIKYLPVISEVAKDTGPIPGVGKVPWSRKGSLESERFPGVGNVIPLHYSCLEDSTSKGAWQAIVTGP